jgi:cell wall-associated NlpC family hydrolase
LVAGLSLAFAGCSLLPQSEPAPRAPQIPEQAQEPAPPAPPRADLAAAMVDSARAMLGQPYRFGGAAPGGFDCSGLVAYSAASVGVHLPRTAREQLQSGWPVGRAGVKTGDLVFMRLARKELHVGIAIDGERFIHAPATGGRVRIDSLAAAPYSGGFLSARRVIDAPPFGH